MSSRSAFENMNYYCDLYCLEHIYSQALSKKALLHYYYVPLFPVLSLGEALKA
jgi:hypothetical protein